MCLSANRRVAFWALELGVNKWLALVESSLAIGWDVCMGTVVKRSASPENRNLTVDLQWMRDQSSDKYKCFVRVHRSVNSMTVTMSQL
jgi:hypothetical protein